MNWGRLTETKYHPLVTCWSYPLFFFFQSHVSYNLYIMFIELKVILLNWALLVVLCDTFVLLIYSLQEKKVIGAG